MPPHMIKKKKKKAQGFPGWSSGSLEVQSTSKVQRGQVPTQIKKKKAQGFSWWSSGFLEVQSTSKLPRRGHRARVRPWLVGQTKIPCAAGHSPKKGEKKVNTYPGNNNTESKKGDRLPYTQKTCIDPQEMAEGLYTQREISCAHPERAGRWTAWTPLGTKMRTDAEGQTHGSPGDRRMHGGARLVLRGPH